MNFSHMITTVDTHTMGEPTRVVTAGIGHIPGATMYEKKQWLSENRDDIRRMLMLEPRGHQDMFGAILTEPVSKDARAGVIFMDGGGYLDMCGHGSIGAVTVLFGTGIIPLDPNKKKITRDIALDTPAGLIHARAEIANGRVSSVTIRNRESFFEVSTEVVLESVGTVSVDIAYGGNYFALVNVQDLGLQIKPADIDPLKQMALEIRSQINQTVKCVHPITKTAAEVALVEIYENTTPPRNIVVFGQGQIDRSPCGTGTSAKMALLYHKGRLKIGKPYAYRSIFGTEFVGTIIQETTINGKPAIIPEITGSAFITGFQQFVVDENDPYKFGFDMTNDIF
ncbi:MAG: proline racemase family protein [Deltaproteobacteria bacterium]|nr:proline racemase family protein [Deltaproteobacteria bacterium]